MSFVPPVFTCGECGGDIARWPMKNLLRQDILDWRHVNVPEGTAPHRAVLGTPVPRVELVGYRCSQEPHPGVEFYGNGGGCAECGFKPDDAPDAVPDPIVPARPALHDDLPGSAVRLDKKGAANGWTVQAWYMHGPLMDARWKFSRMVESVVLWLDRDGHRLVAVWRTENDGSWKFDQAWSLTHWADPLSSPELNAAVIAPRALCESCGEPPALHVSTKWGPVCHPEWKAAMTPKEEQ